jgi:putative endopeptidase
MRIAHIAISALMVGAFASPELMAKKQSTSKAAPTPSACTDFYAHVNTGWLRSNPLPPGEASRSRWNELFELSAKQREELFTGAAGSSNGRAQQQLNALMQSTSEARIQAESTKTLTALLSDIDRVKKLSELSNVVSKLHARGLPVIFNFKAGDQPVFSAGGLGLPEAAFYSSDHPNLVEAQGLYREYVIALLTASGASANNAGTQSGYVMTLERQLAGASGSTQAQIISNKDAAKQYPNLNSFFGGSKAGNSKITIENVNFFKALNTAFNGQNIEAWKNYLRFHVIHQLAPYLAEPYFSERGKFYDVYLAGRSTPASRQEIMRGLIENSAPDIVDAAYQERFANVENDKRALAIAMQIIETAKASSATSAWLSDAAKAQVFETLKTMRVEIGRKDYDSKSLEVGSDMSSNAIALLRRSQKQNEWPSQWSNSAPLISYLPKQNRILISHALLQDYMLDADTPATDYGAFGTLFAQQLSLAIYDNTIRNANEVNTQRVAITNQFNAYPLSAGKKVNGTLTAVQNLADQSGLELAYRAFNASAPRDKKAQQAFFKAWANVWARVDRDSALLEVNNESIYAPYKFRVNGPASNMPAFATAYDCKVGAMQRVAKDQIKIWP